MEANKGKYASAGKQDSEFLSRSVLQIMQAKSWKRKAVRKNLLKLEKSDILSECECRISKATAFMSK